MNPEILRYVNRLSDLCWLWARATGAEGGLRVGLSADIVALDTSGVAFEGRSGDAVLDSKVNDARTLVTDAASAGGRNEKLTRREPGTLVSGSMV